MWYNIIVKGSGIMIKENDMTQIQRYYIGKADEKARIRNIIVNGYKATVMFSEYNAPDDMVGEFEKEGETGHYFYVTFFIWNGLTSYWTDKEISVRYTYLTTKEEGNRIYTEIKRTKKFDGKIEY